MALSERQRTISGTVVKVTVSLLLLSIFLCKSDLAGILAAVRNVHVFTIVKSGCALVAVNLLWALKWNMLIPQVAFRRVLTLTVIAQYYSLILLGQLSGEMIKVYRMGKSTGDAGLLAASVVVDKFASLIALLILALIGMLLSRTTFTGVWIMVIGCFVVVSGVMLLGMFETTLNILMRCILLAPLPKGWKLKLYRYGKQYFNAWGRYLRRPRQLMINLLLSGIAHWLSVLVIMLPATDLGIAVSVTDWFWVYGLMSVAVLLPVSFGGIGIRDGSLIGLLSYMSVSADRSLALSFILFFFIMIGAVAGGGMELFRIFTQRRT